MTTATAGRARRLLVPLVTVAVVLGLTSAAVATPWLPPVELAAPDPMDTFDSPSVATADDGSTVIAFSRRVGSVAQVFAVLRSPGGPLTGAVALSDATTSASSPRAAIDPQGNAVVAWLQAGIVQVASRGAGQAWGPPQPLSAADGTAPTVAAGANGGAAVTWWSNTGSAATQTAKVAVRAPGSPSFSAAATVSSTTAPFPNGGFGVYQPKVAMSDAGEVVAVWARSIDNGGTVRTVVETAVKPAGAAPFAAASGRSSYSAGAASTDPTVVMSPSGRATVLWGYSDGTTSRLDYADRAAGGSFGALATVPWPADTNAASARLASNDDGELALSWSQDNKLWATTRPVGGLFAVPQAVAGAPALTNSSTIAIADSGEAVLAWPTSSVGDYTVYAARRRPGGAFGEISEVVRGQSAAPSTVYQLPVVALDDQGNGFIAARRAVAGPPAGYTSIAVPYDVVAPAITSVGIPAAATVGRAAAFTAGATDRTSAPSYVWDFGDGATASGSSVAHSFAGPGVYTVKVSASDAVGNRSETTRVVQVVPVAGVAATGKLRTKSIAGGRTSLTNLSIAGLQAGDTVAASCRSKARGCKKASLGSVTASAASVSFVKAVKGLRLAARARIVVRVTRAGTAPRTLTWTMRAGAKPKLKVS